MQWQLHPEGIKTVLDRTRSAAIPVVTAFDGLSDSLDPAITGSQSSAIASAVVEFFEAQSPVLQSITDRISAGVYGASAATAAYEQGDQEMAATLMQATSAVMADSPTFEEER
ncbi:DUF6507 family protein [Compostimonas suwonensis]|uniref:Uncharacterized protein n=1 Tax=Compostimonas suwonensis TaxID=1048394 RepID=A0A2M9BVX7_9MICO|nr:DUF6507 family protein [Compostimonas suwonensis]PJJ62101.1 hypothetical protein CLV54_1894 [Compostimonas suwonensis]